jgi:hypothetical protein
MHGSLPHGHQKDAQPCKQREQYSGLSKLNDWDAAVPLDRRRCRYPLGRTLAQRILTACAFAGITIVVIGVLYGFAYGEHHVQKYWRHAVVSMALPNILSEPSELRAMQGTPAMLSLT